MGKGGDGGYIKVETLENEHEGPFPSVLEVPAGSMRRVDRVFERSLNPDQTRQPVAGVRVLVGVKMFNPYPNPRKPRAETRGFLVPVPIPTDRVRIAGNGRL
jgi:hypothetical protein